MAEVTPLEMLMAKARVDQEQSECDKLRARVERLERRLSNLLLGLKMIRDIKPGFSAKRLAESTLREDRRLVKHEIGTSLIGTAHDEEN